MKIKYIAALLFLSGCTSLPSAHQSSNFPKGTTINVTAIGWLDRTGHFLIPENTTLSQFILMTGGFKGDSIQNPVIVERHSEESPEKRTFCIDLRGYDGKKQKVFYLKNDDVVFVKKSLL